MDIARAEVEPQLAGGSMGQAVALLRVQYHFGWAGRAAGEEEDAGVIGLRGLGLERGVGIVEAAVEVGPTGKPTSGDNADA